MKQLKQKLRKNFKSYETYKIIQKRLKHDSKNYKHNDFEQLQKTTNYTLLGE